MDWKNLLKKAPQTGSVPAEKIAELNAALQGTLRSMNQMVMANPGLQHRYFELYLALSDLSEGYFPNERDLQVLFQVKGKHGRSQALEYARDRAPTSTSALENAYGIASQYVQEMAHQTSWRTSPETQQHFAGSLQKSMAVKDSIEKAQPLIKELLEMSKGHQAGQGPGGKPA